MEEELKKQLIGTYCVCNNVLYEEIAVLVHNLKIKDINNLKTFVHVCTRCKLCGPDIQKIIDFYKS